MERIKIGDAALAFELPGVDGKTYSLSALSEGKKATAVVFMCNHCPYVKAMLDRIVRDAADLSALGLSSVAIMSNDPSDYPEDSFDNMKLVAQLPVAEAISCGSPCVVTEIPALREVAEAAALYAAPRDPTALARTMIRALDPTTNLQLRRHSVERASHLSWDPVIRAWADLLGSVIAER